jgi:hypothetical protein
MSSSHRYFKAQSQIKLDLKGESPPGFPILALKLDPREIEGLAVSSIIR